MATLRDIPVVLRRVGPWGFLKRVWNQISEDNIFVWAAALAYSWLFAAFPFAIFLLAIVPYLPLEKNEVMGHIHDFLNSSLPREAANTVATNIDRVVTGFLSRPRGGVLSLGFIVALWAASGGTAMTMSALDRCYDVDINRPFYKQRPYAVLLTAAVALLLLLIMLLLPIGTLATRLAVGWMETQNRYISWPLVMAWNITRWTLAVGLMLLVLAVIYHFGTQVRQRFRWITPGGVFVVLSWVVFGLVFRLYINQFGKYDQTYGTVGGVAILLLVFYIDAAVLLIGAEINSEIDFEILGVPNGTLDFTRKPSPSVADPTMPTP